MLTLVVVERDGDADPASSRKGCVVLSLTGRLNLAAAPQVERAILWRLAKHPAAVTRARQLGLLPG